MEHDFDAIVVGAGPAGSAAAYVLARGGASVLVIDRADRPGAKNTSGGRLYSYALDELDPALAADAPLERPVTKEEITLLDGDRGVTVALTEPGFGAPPQSYTVLRADFDAWLAERAEDAGATVVAGVRVDDLMEQDGRIQGVVAGGDTMTAGVVIAADGVNSLLGQRAGLRGELVAHQIGIGAKQVIALPPGVIEDRFGLEAGQGAARLVLGGVHGLPGGGAFLYTNRASVSLGAVYTASSVAKGSVSLPELIAAVRDHPAIRPLVRDGQVLEYSAHLVPEGGWRAVPRSLHRPGFLMVGDAAGLVINMGYTIRGMDLAILSGVAAGRAALAAPGDDMGPEYVAELGRLGVTAAMKGAAKVPGLVDNKRLFTAYPALLAGLVSDAFTVRSATPPPPLRAAIRRVKEHVPLATAARDLVQAYRAMG